MCVHVHVRVRVRLRVCVCVCACVVSLSVTLFCRQPCPQLIGLPTGDNAAVSACGAGASSLLCGCIVLSADEDDLH